MSRFIFLRGLNGKIIVDANEILYVATNDDGETVIKFKNGDEIYSTWSPDAIWGDLT